MKDPGVKIVQALEELGVPYNCYAVDISKNTQKEPWFLAINPNGRLPPCPSLFLLSLLVVNTSQGRIPAITDTLNGEKVRVFESASILL
jgi:glutathione S-transferase